MVAEEPEAIVDARANRRDFIQSAETLATSEECRVQAEEVSEGGTVDPVASQGVSDAIGGTDEWEDITAFPPCGPSPETESEATVSGGSDTAGEPHVESRSETVGQSQDESNGAIVERPTILAQRSARAPGTRPPESSAVGGLRHAPQYRAPSGVPPSQRVSRSHAKSLRAGRSGAAAPVEIAVRVLFDRSGYCIVSLLPRRLHGQSEELVVSSRVGDLRLTALQEEWYQDVMPESLAEILRGGIAWQDVGGRHEWLLSGREVFVLAPGTTHRGVVSVPRLCLGRSHVILCTVAIIDAVEDLLHAAGCAQWSQVTEDDGAPSGWRVLRNVVPQKPLRWSEGADILNILRPRPEIEFSLEGGTRLAYNDWLLDYPPAIHVFGDPEQRDAVFIDGRKAAVSNTYASGYTAPGWDTEGEHRVSCSGISRTYSLVRGQEDWTGWPAHTILTMMSRSVVHEFEICGPLVRPVITGGRTTSRRAVTVIPF